MRRGPKRGREYRMALSEMTPGRLRWWLHEEGLTLSDAGVADLRRAREREEQHLADVAEEFAWTYGDLSPWELGKPLQA